MNIVESMVQLGSVDKVQVERAGWFEDKPPTKPWCVWAYWDTGVGHRLSTHRFKAVARFYAIGYREMFRQQGAPV